MALPDYLRPSALTSIATGVVSQTVANGATYESTTEFDNTASRHGYLKISVEWSFATAPTANKTVEVRIKQIQDGTNYESESRVIAAFSPPADTATHSQVLLTHFFLLADKYKFLVKNVDTGQTITITVRAYAWTDAQEDN